MKKLLISYTLLSLINSAYANEILDYELLAQNVTVYKKANCINSTVAFVKDSEGKKYVVKQYKHKHRRLVLPTTLCELISLEIGRAVGVAVDTACLIPAGASFIGKDQDIPTSLHVHVPGVPFISYKGDRYPNLCIFLQDDEGFTRDTIHHMSRHKDLAGISALDTYVGNNDRCRQNFFYDEATDSFMGIDLGAAFKRDFCKVSTENMRALLADETTSFSEAEKEGLCIYYNTLKQLVEKFPPETLCSMINDYAQSAGFFDEAYFNLHVQKRWGSCFAGYKKVIRKTYPHAIALLEALEELFEKHGIRNY